MLVDLAWHDVNFCKDGHRRVWHDPTQRRSCISTRALLETHQASNTCTCLRFSRTVALAELLTASRCMRSARCRPFSRLKTRTPNFTFRFLFYDGLLSDESTRRGLQQLGFTPFSWAWSTSPHATGSYATLTKTGAPCAMVLWSDAGGVWLVCNPRVLVFVFLPKPKTQTRDSVHRACQ